jgi:hypothetical protein
VGDVADDGFKHGSEGRRDGGKFIELACAGSADFDDDDEGQGFAAGVLLKGELLRDAIIGENEIFGGKGVDEISGFAANERGDEDERGVCAKHGGLRGR